MDDRMKRLIPKREKWIGNQYGPGKKYKFRWQLAIGCGFGKTQADKGDHMFWNWLKGAHWDLETLKKVAAGTGTQLGELMVLNGDLEEEELEEDRVLCGV